MKETAKTKAVDCYVCRKVRRVVDLGSGVEVCEGCGGIAADVVNRENRKAAARTSEVKPMCPQCRPSTIKVVETEPERFHCCQCGATFERPDMTYVDHRPHQNAEKQEAYRRNLRQRKRRGHHGRH
jgi:ribosomal protein L37AE/L43A